MDQHYEQNEQVHEQNQQQIDQLQNAGLVAETQRIKSRNIINGQDYVNGSISFQSLPQQEKQEARKQTEKSFSVSSRDYKSRLQKRRRQNINSRQEYEDKRNNRVLKRMNTSMLNHGLKTLNKDGLYEDQDPIDYNHDGVIDDLELNWSTRGSQAHAAKTSEKTGNLMRLYSTNPELFNKTVGFVHIRKVEKKHNNVKLMKDAAGAFQSSVNQLHPPSDPKDQQECSCAKTDGGLM
jgi:hypothetical protein